ncbi:MAG TPA: hypothetical protein VFZ78_08160 [Flavisolibacter sp.]
MIDVNELRCGNIILYKNAGRVRKVRCTAQHISMEDRSDLYPVVLKPEIFISVGFRENESYPLRPQAQEFVLTLPVMGVQKSEIRGYRKSNGECFARAVVNDQPASNNVFHLHLLQNLYHALTGSELQVTI